MRWGHPVSAYILTAAETRLADATENADEIDFQSIGPDGRPLTVVRAETLRRMLLGLPVVSDGMERVINLRGPGIRVVKAFIDGKLELDNACAIGGDPLPRLSLIECFIPETISLRAAKMRRLCLKNSRISYLRANDTVIGTQLDLEGVKSSGTAEGAQGLPLCRIALRGAQIEDGIEAREAVLVGPIRRDDYVVFNARSHYALDLAGARIGGDLRLFPTFQAYGGVNMAGIEVSGSVQLHGAQITKEEVHGIDLEGAHVEGHVDLCCRIMPGGDIERAMVRGDVHLSHARIDDGIKLNGALIDGQIMAQYLKVGSDIDASGMAGKVSGKRHNQNFECTGGVKLTGARLEGNLDICGARIADGLLASTSTIGGDLIGHVCGDTASGVVHALSIGGTLQLEGSHIAGNLDLTGAQLAGNLEAKGLNVGGFCHMRSDHDGAHIFHCRGQIEINNAQIGLGLHMSGAMIEKECYAQNIQSGGHVLMGAADRFDVEPRVPFTARGRVSLAGAEIRGDLNLQGAYLFHGIRCRGTQIKSAMLIELMKVPQVAGKQASIDLTNASTNVLLDGPGDGRNYADFILDLEGFEYGRFGLTVDSESALHKDGEHRSQRLADKAWQHRDQWLKRQGKEVYKADTYNTLYRVLKDNGHSTEATSVLREKLKFERKSMNWGINKLLMTWYGWLFGFGLTPWQAILTFSLLYLAVFAGVHYANFQPKPVSPSTPLLQRLETTPVSTAAAYLQPGLRANVLVVQPITPAHVRRIGADTEDYVVIDNGSGQHEIACGERLKPMLYTLDLILPAVDLHQIDRCDLSDRAGWSWSILKALATLLGWTITSLTILTLSGILRRQSEPN